MIHQEIQPFNFLKYIILVEYKRKNEFSSNNATYSLYNMGYIEHPYRYNLFTFPLYKFWGTQCAGFDYES